MGVLYWGFEPEISRALRRNPDRKIAKVQLTEQEARQKIIQEINIGGIATNPKITSMKLRNGVWDFKGEATVNGANTNFRGKVDEGGNTVILGEPTCRVCRRPMALLDEKTQRYYCYKDDELSYINWGPTAQLTSL